jgi:N-acetylmuramoyl-L-alanine amidase
MSTPTSARRTRPPRKGTAPARYRLLDTLSLAALLAAVLLIVATGLFNVRGLREPRPLGGLPEVQATPPPEAPLVVAATEGIPTVLAPTMTAEPSPTPLPPTGTPESTATPLPPTITPSLSATLPPTFTATPGPPTVALVAGHRNNDSGAVCESGPYEGLQEVQITTDVTARLKQMLEARGYEVVDLDEFDSRLNGLEADALLSIHVDSCVDWEGTTGFKVARASNSAIPDIEDEFVACMSDEYGAATGLRIHHGSITHNMTLYHAFRRVAPTTPGVIIELGFLYHDHDLLTRREEVLTEGLFRGVECFLRDEG